MEVVGSTIDDRTSLRLASTLLPDILILDSSLYGYGIIEIIRKVLGDNPSTRILILIEFFCALQAETYRAGAVICLKPDSTPAELILAIRTVCRSPAGSGRTLVRGSASSGDAEASHDTGLRPRILIVDDDRAFRKMLALILDKSAIRCCVKSAENVPQAMKKTIQFRPHLLITDLEMPHIKGDELCWWVKSNGFKTTAVLVISGDRHSRLLISAKQAGADGWLSKPLEFAAFIFTVRWMLNHTINSLAIGSPEMIRGAGKRF
jgi:DNA-binding NarL/FixJ family response regulator